MVWTEETYKIYTWDVDFRDFEMDFQTPRLVITEKPFVCYLDKKCTDSKSTLLIDF